MALSRRLCDLPEIQGAVAGGQIGYEAASLIARVAGVDTVQAWIARAGQRTVKHLREGVEANELLARADGLQIRRMAPPAEATMGDVRALERAVIGAVTGQMSGVDAVTGQMSGTEPDTAITPEPGATTTVLRLAVSEETGRFWRALEAVHARLWLPGSFVAFLVRAVMKTWTGALPAKVAYADIYLRDRWRCASPVCVSRNVVFRSHGGSEDPGNLVSLCERCHLDLVHGGSLTVRGQVGALSWEASGWTMHERGLRGGEPALVVGRAGVRE